MLSASFASLAVVLASLSGANAWFRVACTGPLVQERVDPIISPGVAPSNHVHTGQFSRRSAKMLLLITLSQSTELTDSHLMPPLILLGSRLAPAAWVRFPLCDVYGLFSDNLMYAVKEDLSNYCKR